MNKDNFREYYQKNKDKRRKQQMKWREENKEKIKENSKKDREKLKGKSEEWKEQNRMRKKESNLKMKFGLTQKDYNKLLEQQNGVCAICGCEPNGKKLAVDHNHKTEKNRGLLCTNCNLCLGLLKEDIFLFKEAIKYLKKWGVPK